MARPAFTCEASALAKALRDVRSCVRGRSEVPILNHVLIEARDGALRLTASDLNLTAVRTIPAQVEVPGRTTIEAERLADIAGALNAGSQARLEEVEGSRVTLVSGRSRFRFATLPAESYPDVQLGEAVSSVTMKVADLAKALGTVRHAASTDAKTRYYMNGVHVSVFGDQLRYLTTDGNRAGRWLAPLPAGGENIPATILALSFVDAVMKAMGNFDGEVGLTFTDTRVRAELGDFIITAKPIDATFPDVDRLVPSAPPIRLSTDADDLSAALRRISLMRTDREGALKLSVKPEAVVVSGISHTTGEEGVEQLACEYAGDAFDIGFRSQLLRDAISALDVDSVEFGITETFGAPVRLRSNARPEATLLVMPFRI